MFQSNLYCRKDEKEENTILLWAVFLASKKQSEIVKIQNDIITQMWETVNFLCLASQWKWKRRSKKLSVLVSDYRCYKLPQI